VGEINISNTHNVFCRKFAAICLPLLLIQFTMPLIDCLVASYHRTMLATYTICLTVLL